MFRQSSAHGRARSCLGNIATVVKVVLLVVVGGLLLLELVNSPRLGDFLPGFQSKGPLIGLLAGHWQNDSGAVCKDGLREVDINLEVARRAAALLRQRGYRVEILPEFSAKLNGYQADVFLAIHSDSCIENLSGFKVARMTHSSVPEREDLLVQALYQAYGEATGLKPHLNTVTEDMRQYHALRRIAPETPGAIIELGFMGGDRYLLTHEQDRVAVGIANGLSAFLRQYAPTATPRK